MHTCGGDGLGDGNGSSLLTVSIAACQLILQVLGCGAGLGGDVVTTSDLAITNHWGRAGAGCDHGGRAGTWHNHRLGAWTAPWPGAALRLGAWAGHRCRGCCAWHGHWRSRAWAGHGRRRCWGWAGHRGRGCCAWGHFWGLGSTHRAALQAQHTRAYMSGKVPA